MAEVITALQDAQQAMHLLLVDVAPDRLERAPSDRAWSVAQIVEHLAMVEDGTGRLISKLLKQVDGTIDQDVEPIAPTMARFRVDDAAARPIEAPDMVTPRGILTFAQASALQSAARERLIAALTAASGRALTTVEHPHPILGSLNGYQWAIFVALHQRRHFAQIRHTLNALPH